VQPDLLDAKAHSLVVDFLGQRLNDEVHSVDFVDQYVRLFIKSKQFLNFF
jgi:hypothetical protein